MQSKLTKPEQLIHPFDKRTKPSLISQLARPRNIAALSTVAFAVRPQLAGADLLLHNLPANLTLIDVIGERTLRHLFAAFVGLVVGYGGSKLAQKSRLVIIKKLLAYNGWIYNGKSLRTKLWGWLLRTFIGSATMTTFAMQPLLPRFPLPSLNDSLNKWLEVARYLESEEQFAITQQIVENFRNSEGPQLQKLLLNKARTCDNWMSEYWQNAVYLSCREPLLVNSNYAGTNGVKRSYTTDALARAATNIHLFAAFAEMVATETLPPVLVQNAIPFCMDGYKYLFRMTRIPGEHIDTIKRYPHSKHAIIIRKGHYFKLDLFTGNSPKTSLLSFEEIKIQLRKICDIADSLPDEAPVAVLTSQNRTKWSQQRKILMEKNADVLEAVESAIFIYVIDTFCPKDVSEFSKMMITGNGTDRWFDKSITSCISGDSLYSGSNLEHSLLDAMVFGSMGEWVMTHERYENGDVIKCSDSPPRNLPTPNRLLWDVTGLETCIDDAMKLFKLTVDNFDVKVLTSDYGMGFAKKCKMSPDGYVQMALQLAYYRLHHEIPKTYEPATSRLFLLGRTETINPVSADSIAWVKAMLDAECNLQTKRLLLARAIERQSCYRLDATVGKGCDRHLLALLCASRESGMDLPKLFTDTVWRAPYKLSSSQTPTNIYTYRKDIEWPACTGGFGPTCHDGYGVCYVFFGDDIINFNVTNWKSCGVTDAARFVQSLQQALAEMKQLLTN